MHQGPDPDSDSGAVKASFCTRILTRNASASRCSDRPGGFCASAQRAKCCSTRRPRAATLSGLPQVRHSAARRERFWFVRVFVCSDAMQLLVRPAHQALRSFDPHGGRYDPADGSPFLLPPVRNRGAFFFPLRIQGEDEDWGGRRASPNPSLARRATKRRPANPWFGACSCYAGRASDSSRSNQRHSASCSAASQQCH